MKMNASLLTKDFSLSLTETQMAMETALLKYGYDKSLTEAAHEYDRATKSGSILNMPKGKRVFLDTLNSVSTWLNELVEIETKKKSPSLYTKYYIELILPFVTRYLQDQQNMVKFRQEAKYENPLNLLPYFITTELTRSMVVETRMVTELSRRAVNSYVMSYYNYHKDASTEQLVAMIQLVRTYLGSPYNKYFLGTTTKAGVTVSLSDAFAGLFVTKEELLETISNDKSPYKPMLVNPVAHTNLLDGDGGYLELASPLLKNPEFDIIRQMEFNSTSHPSWFKAINNLQSTQWQINVPFLTWLKECTYAPVAKHFANDAATLRAETSIKVKALEKEIKQYSKLVSRVRFEASNTTAEDRKEEIKVEVSNAMDAIELLELEIHSLNSYVGKVQGWETTLNDAEYYSHFEYFYHPLFCDNRGRVYTYNTTLSFQGSSLSKSIIQTKKKYRLNREGIASVMELLGGMFEGYSKKTKEIRIKLVKKNLTELFEVIEHKSYDILTKLDEDELLQALVLIHELYHHYHNPKYKTGVLAYIDSTSSAIQIQALAQKCVKAASLTNLMKPGGDDLPDAYMSVANSCRDLVQEISTQSNEELYATMIMYYTENAPEKLEYVQQ